MTAVDDKVAELAADGFEVGDPVTDQGSDGAGRTWQQFAHAWLMGEPDGSCWTVWGATLDAYNRTGGIARHGFPTGAQAPSGRDDTTVWDFEAGTRIYEVGGDAGVSYALWPPLLARYDELGGPTGELGGPAMDETVEGDVAWAQLEHGAALGACPDGVHHLSAGVQAAYRDQGGVAGALGAPLQDSDTDPGGAGEAGVFGGGTLFVAPDGTATVEAGGAGPGGTVQPTPTASTTPARAMTLDEAWAELCALHRAGALVLADSAPAADGPLPATPRLVRFKPEVLHGVEYRYTDLKKTYRHVMEQIDPRHGVALARLAAWASSTYGVTVITHLGLGGSAGRTDCHGQGRALDLAGVQGTRDGVAFDWQVLRDWGTRSVPDEADPAAPRLKAWPPGRRDLTFRLASDPDADPAVVEFFAAVYAFCAGEWQDLDDQPSAATTPSTIGTRSFLMNPDHPASDPGGPHGREAHRDHLHAQIGRTGSQ